MPLRCLLFCSGDGAAELIGGVLNELGIEAEHCPDSFSATDKVTSQNFQIVVLDWDIQPEAALLLNAARTRRAQERPLALALVEEDTGVPKALQAGANSVLRKPLAVHQVRDTLTTARDLLRSKLEQSSTANGPGKTAGTISVPGSGAAKPSLRAGEFLQSAPLTSSQFVTESDVEKNLTQTIAPSVIDPLQELEPMGGTLEAKKEEAPPSLPAQTQSRGLAWHLRTKKPPAIPPEVLASVTAAAAGQESKPAELLTFNQTPSFAEQMVSQDSTIAQISNIEETPRPSHNGLEQDATSRSATPLATPESKSEAETEAQLFAYMDGQREEKKESPPRLSGGPRSRGQLALFAAACVALIALIGWWKTPAKARNPKLEQAENRAVTAAHAWLNPQPITPVQAPRSHESFARAGDEYKLPAAEPIPDATTDPEQIQVVPVIDPTVKQPNANVAPAFVEDTAPASGQPTSGSSAASDSSTAVSSSEIMNPQAQPASSSQNANTNTPANSTPVPSATVVTTPVAPLQQRTSPAAAPSSPRYTAVNVGIPSSLRSQIASMTPDASGNKPPEAAMSAIEPVSVPEATARNLLSQQTVPAYPASAKGQTGTVVLQVLIGRDGTVQDAKFLQGSLLFARSAIDAVKQWRFQPYLMNGRAVSTVTSLAINFKPTN